MGSPLCLMASGQRPGSNSVASEPQPAASSASEPARAINVAPTSPPFNARHRRHFVASLLALALGRRNKYEPHATLTRSARQ